MSFGVSATKGNPQIQLIEQLQTPNFCKSFKLTKQVFWSCFIAWPTITTRQGCSNERTYVASWIPFTSSGVCWSATEKKIVVVVLVLLSFRLFFAHHHSPTSSQHFPPPPLNFFLVKYIMNVCVQVFLTISTPLSTHISILE